MDGNSARMRPAPAAFGTLLLVMSGVLLAADIGLTRMLRVDEQSLVQRSSIARAPVQPDRSCAPHHTCVANAVAREPHIDQQATSRANASAAAVRTSSSNRVAALERVSTSAPLTGPAHITAAKPSAATHEQLSPYTHLSSPTTATLPEAYTRWGADSAQRPPAAPPLVAAPALPVPAAEQQSAMRRAKFSVVQMVKAETHGVQWIRASAHAKGRDRLIVRVVAHMNTGTFYEYDVLRRNGIGFAVESRRYRTVLRARAGHAKNGDVSVQDAGP